MVQSEFARSRVLVVDDDTSMLLLVRSVLEAAGYECRTASSAAEALGVLRSVPGILVAISDINMSGVDGIAFLKEIISSRVAFASIPRVIFLTAHSPAEYAVAALRLGAVDFLSKPLHSSELLSAVQAAVERMNREREALQVPAQVAALLRQAAVLADALGGWRLPPVNPSAAVDSAPHGDSDAVKPDGQTPSAAGLPMLGLDHVRPPRSFAPFGELDDVAWDLLLQVLRSEESARRLSVSALSISVSVSQTTALRRIQELVKAGHIVRHPDPMDARRDFVALAPETKAAMERYLQHVLKELIGVAVASQ